MQFKMAENGKQTITTYYLSMNDSLIKELQYNKISLLLIAFTSGQVET